MDRVEESERVDKNPREEIIEAIRSGADPERLKGLLFELNDTLGLARLAYFAPQSEEILDEELERFSKGVGEGHAGITIVLGDGSSRLALEFNSVTETEENKQVKVFLSKASVRAEEAWKKLQ